MIVQVTGGFTVAYSAVVLLAGVVATVWGGLVVWRARRTRKYLGIARPLSFPPRLYSVVSLASAALGGMMMQWGLSAKFALDTGALLPHATTFTFGHSWLIVALIKIHCALLQFILWHTVESAWDPNSEDDGTAAEAASAAAAAGASTAVSLLEGSASASASPPSPSLLPSSSPSSSPSADSELLPHPSGSPRVSHRAIAVGVHSSGAYHYSQAPM
jgi:hypothetical protein